MGAEPEALERKNELKPAKWHAALRNSKGRLDSGCWGNRPEKTVAESGYAQLRLMAPRRGSLAGVDDCQAFETHVVCRALSCVDQPVGRKANHEKVANPAPAESILKIGSEESVVAGVIDDDRRSWKRYALIELPVLAASCRNLVAKYRTSPSESAALGILSAPGGDDCQAATASRLDKAGGCLSRRLGGEAADDATLETEKKKPRISA